MSNIEIETSGNRLLYSAWCKRSDRETAEPDGSLEWAPRFRWWRFRIAEDRIQCGDWAIPFSGVTKATVYKVKGWLVTFTIIRLEAEGKIFQFGFNAWARSDRHLKLNYKKTELKVKNARNQNRLARSRSGLRRIRDLERYACQLKVLGQARSVVMSYYRAANIIYQSQNRQRQCAVLLEANGAVLSSRICWSWQIEEKHR